MKRLLMIATAVGALAFAAAPAGADPQPPESWICDLGGDNFYPMESSPGEKKWVVAVQACIDAGGHPMPVGGGK